MFETIKALCGKVRDKIRFWGKDYIPYSNPFKLPVEKAWRQDFEAAKVLDSERPTGLPTPGSVTPQGFPDFLDNTRPAPEKDRLVSDATAAVAVTPVSVRGEVDEAIAWLQKRAETVGEQEPVPLHPDLPCASTPLDGTRGPEDALDAPGTCCGAEECDECGLCSCEDDDYSPLPSATDIMCSEALDSMEEDIAELADKVSLLEAKMDGLIDILTEWYEGDHQEPVVLTSPQAESQEPLYDADQGVVALPNVKMTIKRKAKKAAKKVIRKVKKGRKA